MIKISEDARRFYRSLFALVLPIALQSFIGNAVNSADVLMLGYVGQTELSAVSLANQFQFLLSGFFFGAVSGVTMLVSQYWGKRDTYAIQSVMGIGLRISLLVTAVVSAAAMIAPRMLMTIYTADPALIDIGAEYLRIVGTSYILLSFSQMYECVLRSTEHAALSTAIGTAALLINVVLNAVFIFGAFGLPRMGVAGVAVATLISRILECLLCVADYARGHCFAPQPSLLFHHEKLLIQDYLKYAAPALANDCSWTLAFSFYSVILGHLNADIVAASAIATTVRDLFTILCFALSSGATVLLGIEIGQGRLERAKRDAARSCHATLVIGAAVGAVLVLVRPLVLMCFTLTERAADYLMGMLLISGYYVIGQAINTLVISGIFRAGGDSRFGLICDTVTMWCVSLPLGFLCAFVLRLPPMVVYFVLCLDEFWKLPAVYCHYKKYGWLKDITRKIPHDSEP